MTGEQVGGYDPHALRDKYLAERDKRLRSGADGHGADGQYAAAEGDLATFAYDPNVAPGFVREPRKTDIDTLIVGGGFGGLLTAARLAERGVEDFLIVEQGGDFGGTWYWNRYPGVRCDIESYIYMPLLEEVGTIPSERYAQGAEIFAHCQAIGRHYRLYERALFQTRVTSLDWDEAAGRWTARTDRGDVIRARFVTVSQGPLAKVKLPRIPGIQDFAGKMFHTSRWDYDYTGGDATGGMERLRDKRIAVIGTGATAIQAVPKLAETTQALYVFQRTPSAIDERNNEATNEAWFKAQPRGWLTERRDNFLSVITGAPHDENVVGDKWTDFWVRFGAAMHAAHASGAKTPPPVVMQGVDYAKMEELRARVSATVEDATIAEALKPWYNYLCKRPLYSDEFLQAFALPNVHLVDTDGRGVEAITADAIVAGGVEYPVDCIIFATGFDVGAPAHKVGGYSVTGRDGVSLDAKWSQGIRSLHGMQVNGFPNFMVVGGTAQGTTAFNFTHVLDMQAVHAAELIGRGLDEDIRAFEPSAAAEDRWLAVLEAKHVDHQQFYEDCTPGFLNNEGDFKDRPTFVGGTYGGGPIEYEKLITAWRDTGFAEDMVVTRGDATRTLATAGA